MIKFKRNTYLFSLLLLVKGFAAKTIPNEKDQIVKKKNFGPIVSYYEGLA